MQRKLKGVCALEKKSMSGSASHVACRLMPPILLSMGDWRTCDILSCNEQSEAHKLKAGTGSVRIDGSENLPLTERAR